MLRNNLNSKEIRVWDTIKHNTSTEGVAVFMMGIPASGKSTVVNLAISDMGFTREQFIDVDPDDFMAFLNGYNNTRAGDFNRSGVVIASNILKRIHASTDKYKYIYYGTGKNYSSYITMINKAKKAGYTTVLVNVKIELPVALSRAAKRTRKVSPRIISNINSRLKTKYTRTVSRKRVNLTSYEILHDKVDLVYVINNNGYKPVIEYKKV